MSLVIEITPEAEAQLAQEAARHGQSIEEFAGAVLEDSLARLALEASKPAWLRLVEIGDNLPQEELERLPADASENLDHYLYGTPRKP